MHQPPEALAGTGEPKTTLTPNLAAIVASVAVSSLMDVRRSPICCLGFSTGSSLLATIAVLQARTTKTSSGTSKVINAAHF